MEDSKDVSIIAKYTSNVTSNTIMKLWRRDTTTAVGSDNDES